MKTTNCGLSRFCGASRLNRQSRSCGETGLTLFAITDCRNGNSPSHGWVVRTPSPKSLIIICGLTIGGGGTPRLTPLRSIRQSANSSINQFLTWSYHPGTHLRLRLTYGASGYTDWTYEPNRDLLTQVRNHVYGNVVSQDESGWFDETVDWTYELRGDLCCEEPFVPVPVEMVVTLRTAVAEIDGPLWGLLTTSATADYEFEKSVSVTFACCCEDTAKNQNISVDSRRLAFSHSWLWGLGGHGEGEARWQRLEFKQECDK